MTDKLELDNTEVKQLSFEDALKQLQQIAEKLERGDAPLEEMIRWYERGTALKTHCETLLKKAELRFEKINFADNSPGDAADDSPAS